MRFGMLSPSTNLGDVYGSHYTLTLLSAFPWKDEDYPGDPSMPLEERIELYKREYWKTRLGRRDKPE